ncbi:Methylthioribose-1-phosphate isomerase [Enterobacter hormaechei]|nr:Methylthioribose-1-phosphate isomerase [Enterobacter hormaechei]
MQTLQTTSLRVANNQLFILDQQALPQEKRWVDASTVEALVGHIHALRVRGAPLIGLSASLLLALLAESGKSRDELAVAMETLRASRPTAVNLMNNLDRMKPALWEEDFVPALVAEALRLIDEDKRLCDAIAKAGSALVKPGSRLLTHCNTGGLATAGVGTALGVIARAHKEGKVSNVWVDETRPLLQGGRLTAWELGELGVPYQLITDSMAASLMAKGQVDAVWVGQTALRPTATWRTKSAPTLWRCWRNSTAFRSMSPRRKRPSTRTARTATRSRLSSAPPAR